MVDASIIHPSAILGKVVRNNNELLGCRGDPGASAPGFKDANAFLLICVLEIRTADTGKKQP